MGTLDTLALIAYFLVVAAIGYRTSRTSSESAGDYFLGGRSVGWMAIGASLFASNISAEHFIGLAGSGREGGLAIGQFEWLACFILLLLGFLFAPFYLDTGVYTMPEFLERRYSPWCRRYLSGVSLLAYVFTKISVAVYAGALVLETLLGWNLYLGAFALLVSTGAYTMFGGLAAVIYTDFAQAFLLLGGGALLSWKSLVAVGGWSALKAGLDPSFFTVWHPWDHPEYPWTGILFGAPILGIWYWCTDQMIVQRTLAAKDLRDAQKATVFAGFLKLFPVFLLVLPGMAGRILMPEVPTDQLYAALVTRLLPPGIKGLVVAGLLAALMSSLSSVFNSASTLFVMDFYQKARPKASEAELVRAGRAATVALVLVGLAWIPFVSSMSKQLYLYLQSVQAYISPPIAVVFLAGVLWPRANAAGAKATLATGLLVGGTRFALEAAGKPGWVPAWFFMNFLHFACFLALVSTLVLVGVSLATEPPPAESIEFLTRRKSPEPPPLPFALRLSSWVLVGAVLALWWIFR